MLRMRAIFIIFLSIQFISPSAVSQYILEGKNIKATFNPGGDLFVDPVTFLPGFEVPKNSGLYTIYAGQFWIGGIDSATSNLTVSAQTYRQTITSWYPGPNSIIHTGFYDSVFFASQSQVTQHLANYQTPGYQSPQNFYSWPAMGIVPNGEPNRLAPFVDLDSDGFYNPQNGDHPRVIGSESAYMIFNDVRDTINPQGNPCCLGLDVHLFTYDLSYVNQDLENTLFLNYKVVNRSNRNYKDIYFGLWIDPDIGNWQDDYIGCDTVSNTFFAYNADNDDEGGSGYGSNPPAQGVVYLSHPLSAFISYDNNSDSVSGIPQTDQEFYNYMSGKWKDGSNVTFGGDGKDPLNPVTTFIYSGNGWTEEAVGNGAGDRRMLGTVGPMDLEAGDSVCLDLAMIYFRNSSQSNLLNRDSLVRLAKKVQDFYDSQTLSCFDPFPIPLVMALEENGSRLEVYPNPATDRVFIRSSLGKKILGAELHDLQGKSVKNLKITEQGLDLTVDVSGIQKGLYLLQIETKEGSFVKKISKR